MEEPPKSTNAARQKRYRERHPERVKEQSKRQYRKHEEYHRTYREVHKDERSTYKKVNRAQNLEAIHMRDRDYSQSKRIRERLEVLATLGGKCVRCGIDDWRVLQIDHVNGGGTHERKQATSLTRYYKDMLIFPEKYQILCANCHQIKRYEEKEGRKYR